MSVRLALKRAGLHNAIDASKELDDNIIMCRLLFSNFV